MTETENKRDVPEGAHEPGATRDAGDATTASRPKPEPVRTLVELFTVKGANPKKLLRELEKAKSWQFAPADADAALDLLGERDPHLQRTRQLLHEAINTRDGRFARTAGDFALRAIAKHLGGGSEWLSAEKAEPVQSLTRVCDTLAPQLDDPKLQRRSHNILMIVVDVLSARHGLSFEAAAPALRTAVGQPREYERRRSNPRRHRIASLTDPRNDLSRVRDLLDLLRPWESELRAQQAELRTASEARQEAEYAAAHAGEHVATLEKRISDLESELEEARQAARASSDQARDVQIVASSDVAEVRARSVAFLNTRLRDLLSTAKEASEIDPPRSKTALRLLNQALDEMERETQWLRSSA